MTDAKDTRSRWLEDEVARVDELVVLAIPVALAVVALFLPMFQYVDPAGSPEGTISPAGTEESTLLGLFFDPGSTGPTTAIRVAALVVALGLVVTAASVGPWTRDRSTWSGTVMVAAAGATLLAAIVLWQMTRQHDDQGRFGTEGVDPTFQLVLAMVVPTWFLAARGRSSRR